MWQVRFLARLTKDINALFRNTFAIGPIDHCEMTTALHVAVSLNQSKIISELIDSGADVFIEDNDGYSPLWYADAEDDVVALLNAAHEMEDGRVHDIDAIFSFAMYRYGNNSRAPTRPSLGVIKLLLEVGKANPNAIDSFHDTPLTIAAQWCDPAMVETLLQHGAYPNLVPPDRDDNWLQPLGRVVLRQKDRGNDAEKMAESLVVADLLLQYGESPDIQTLNTSPLIEAAAVGATEIARLLIAQGANVNRVVAVNHDGHTSISNPLKAALLEKEWDMATFLLTAGADINHPGIDVLSTLINRHSMSGIQYVLSHGVRLNGDQEYIFTILEHHERGLMYCWFCYGHWYDDVYPTEEDASCFEILNLLIEHGARFNRHPKSIGDSAIFAAVTHGDSRMIETVFSHGGDIQSQMSVENYTIYTPLHHAMLCGSGSPQVINFLLDNGASPCAGHTVQTSPLACLILRNQLPCSSDKLNIWNPTLWYSAQNILEHERCGPLITSEFPPGLMALFLRKAITSIRETCSWGCDYSSEYDSLVDMILLFARLTDTGGRWGPDGISGLRELTLRPEYWLHGQDSSELREMRDRLITASRVIAGFCPGRGKSVWFLTVIEPDEKANPGSEAGPDDALLSAFQLLFGKEE